VEKVDKFLSKIKKLPRRHGKRRNFSKSAEEGKKVQKRENFSATACCIQGLKV